MAVETYFLGANSANGFYSLYDSFCSPNEENFLWVIKGGPGCGKSSFMRTIGKAAEEKGLNVHYVLCSGDPDSLDAVYIPELKTGYVDGTAPHITEVQMPGAFGSYLDLGQFYDREALQKERKTIREINRQYKAIYAKVYAILAAINRNVCSCIVPENCQKRFQTAISCKGIVKCGINAEKEEVSQDDINRRIGEAADDDIVFLHPLWPFCAQGILVKNESIYYHSETRFPNCDSAISYLKETKDLHDKLEKIYNPHVNFDGVYNLAAEHIHKYL